MIRDPLERLISDYYFKRYNVGYLFPMSSEDRDRVSSLMSTKKYYFAIRRTSLIKQKYESIIYRRKPK